MHFSMFKLSSHVEIHGWTVDCDHCVYGTMLSAVPSAVIVVGLNASTGVLVIQLTRQHRPPPGKTGTRSSTTERRRNIGQRESTLKVAHRPNYGDHWRRYLSGTHEHPASSHRHRTTLTCFSSISMRRWGLYVQPLMIDNRLYSVQLLACHFWSCLHALRPKSVSWSLSLQRSPVRSILFWRFYWRSWSTFFYHTWLQWSMPHWEKVGYHQHRFGLQMSSRHCSTIPSVILHTGHTTNWTIQLEIRHNSPTHCPTYKPQGQSTAAVALLYMAL